jgi:hypothetical protein
MAVNDLLGATKKIFGSGKASIATATTTTVVDVNLGLAATGYAAGDRVLVVGDLSTAGTTDTTAG